MIQDSSRASKVTAPNPKWVDYLVKEYLVQEAYTQATKDLPTEFKTSFVKFLCNHRKDICKGDLIRNNFKHSWYDHSGSITLPKRTMNLHDEDCENLYIQDVILPKFDLFISEPYDNFDNSVTESNLIDFCNKVKCNYYKDEPAYHNDGCIRYIIYPKFYTVIISLKDDCGGFDFKNDFNITIKAGARKQLGLTYQSIISGFPTDYEFAQQVSQTHWNAVESQPDWYVPKKYKHTFDNKHGW